MRNHVAGNFTGNMIVILCIPSVHGGIRSSHIIAVIESSTNIILMIAYSLSNFFPGNRTCCFDPPFCYS